MSQKLILSVEDDESTSYLIRIAFKEVAPTIEVHRAVDGDAALDYLRELQDSGRQLPGLILMNLNLPKRTGFELLEEMKKTGLLHSVPVVIFSSSALDSDKARCLALGAKRFFTKPVDFDEVIQTIQSVCAMIQ